MKKGQETKAVLKDLTIYHQNLPKKEVEMHSHVHAHLFIPIRGNIKITFNEEAVNLSPGKMLFLSGNTKHSFQSSDVLGERLIVTLKSSIKKNSIMPANSLVKELLFHILVDPTSVSGNKSVSIVKQLLKEIIQSDFFDVSQLHSRAKDSRIVSAIEYMNSNLDQPMEMISKSVGSSSKTLTRLFKVELNLTPKQVQSALRIDKARTLLIKGDKNVTEVAFEVGYKSLSSFIKNYRQITGNLPSSELK